MEKSSNDRKTHLSEASSADDFAAEKGEAIGLLLTHYGIRDDLDEATIARIARDWREDLASYPLADVEEACRQYRRTATRRPVPADIIAICDRIHWDRMEGERERRRMQRIPDIPKPSPEEIERRKKFHAELLAELQEAARKADMD